MTKPNNAEPPNKYIGCSTTVVKLTCSCSNSAGITSTKAKNDHKLFSATRVFADSVTGPLAPTSWATCNNTAGDEEIKIAAMTAAITGGNCKAHNKVKTPVKLSTASARDVSNNPRFCRIKRKSSEVPSRYKISASAISIKIRACCNASSFNRPKPPGPIKKPTAIKPVILGNQDQRCAK